MKFFQNSVRSLPILVAAAALDTASGGNGIAILLALPATVALVVGPRIRPLSVPSQVLWLVVCGLVGVFLAALISVPDELEDVLLRPVFARLGYSALLLASLRLNLRAPLWGEAGTLGAGLIVLLAAGSVKSGGTLPLTLLLFASAAFATLRIEGVEKNERGTLANWGMRHALAAAGLLTTTAVLALLLSSALPRVYTAAYFWALKNVGHRSQTGFNDGPIHLGTLEGLLESWEVVMRVTGHPGDQLRGNVYTHYAAGDWRTTRNPAERKVEAREPESLETDSAVSDIRFAKGKSDRFFLPARTGRFYLQPNSVRVDRMGVVRTEARATAERVVILPDDERNFSIAPPEVADLELPRDIRDELLGIVEDWTAGTPELSDQLEIIKTRLESEFVYSLDFSRSSKRGDPAFETDPILDFLLHDRQGHCEYFASAMTLLARAADMPARLVTGYRVSEYNALGDYHIVRDRHAHAWSEVFLPERGWVTVDPSPLQGTSLAEDDITPAFSALIDYAVVLWQRWGLEFLLVFLVLGLSAAQIWRLLSENRRTRGTHEDFPGPPSWIDDFLARLADAGTPRHPNEPLESLARRIASPSKTDEALGITDTDAADLLYRYAAFRYGREGMAENIQSDVEGWLERNRRALG